MTRSSIIAMTDSAKLGHNWPPQQSHIFHLIVVTLYGSKGNSFQQ